MYMYPPHLSQLHATYTAAHAAGCTVRKKKNFFQYVLPLNSNSVSQTEVPFDQFSIFTKQVHWVISFAHGTCHSRVTVFGYRISG